MLAEERVAAPESRLQRAEANLQLALLRATKPTKNARDALKIRPGTGGDEAGVVCGGFRCPHVPTVNAEAQAGKSN